MYLIHFRFEEKEKQPVAVEAHTGDSILEVALKNDIELHHNCGGVNACSTCHIYIDSGDDLVEEITDREEDFIDRARNPRLNSRLSCQCVLLEGSGKLEVTIPDQSDILGE
jgi:2Fe-2S ferredoxin